MVELNDDDDDDDDELKGNNKTTKLFERKSVNNKLVGFGG